MNLRLKNTLVIVGTLLLGVVIGFLVSGRLTRIRIENMRQDFARQGMDYRFMRALDPSPEQMEDIRPIFDKYNEIRREQFEEHLERQRRIFGDFESELRPYLSPRQLEKMDRIKRDFGHDFPGFRRHMDGRGDKHMRGRGMRN
jgi:hypothetical protein